jgi:hypothetical protein
MLVCRHCERSEAIEAQLYVSLDCFVALLLAMTMSLAQAALV